MKQLKRFAQEFAKEIGEEVEKNRIRQGFTIIDICKATAVPMSQYYNIVHGKGNFLTKTAIAALKIASYLDIKESPKQRHIPDANLIYVQGGTFQMGYDPNRDGRVKEVDVMQDAVPLHSVALRDFLISENQITNYQYAAFLNEYGSDTVQEGPYKGEKMITEHPWGVTKIGNQWQAQDGYENHPVIFVTWFGAQEFCLFYDGSLPSEAQWEYAARGGNKSKGYRYAGSNKLGEVAWHRENSYKKGENHPNYGTQPVRQKKPNELGLYDMSGNAEEWCLDLYTIDYKAKESVAYNPPKTVSQEKMHKVIRGGSFIYANNSAYRDFNLPNYAANDLGFRFCITI